MSDEHLEQSIIELDLPYWLAFHQLSGSGLGSRRVRLLFEHFHSLQKAWEATAGDLKELRWLTLEMISSFIERRAHIYPQQLADLVQKSGVQAYSFYHPQYPALLREINDPPLVIFVRGRFEASFFQQSVGIVGTRNPTSYGKHLAKEFARSLASCGATIISGMAVGVDSLAHWGAIECGGTTLAVLGSGVDHCYPTSNRPLHEKLASGTHGALLSEFFPGVKPEQWRFPARNRIISGLSKAVLVIEAGETSGSLITAKLAFEQNREVFAIPGRIDSEASRGTNHLIARNMAHLVTEYQDILREMNWVPASAPAGDVATMVELFGKEREIFELISQEPIHFDVISQKLSISANELSASLTMLELAGVVSRLPGDWYERQKSSFQVR
jgi:DNA processing protein